MANSAFELRFVEPLYLLRLLARREHGIETLLAHELYGARAIFSDIRQECSRISG